MILVQFELVKKAFIAEDGSKRDYYVLVHKLADGTDLEVTLKGDKAKLLIMSYNLSKK